MHHGKSFFDFGFEDESDGTRRIFDLLDTLVGRRRPSTPASHGGDVAMLAELLQEIKGLPKKEQLYLLDVIRALKARLGETD